MFGTLLLWHCVEYIHLLLISLSDLKRLANDIRNMTSTFFSLRLTASLQQQQKKPLTFQRVSHVKRVSYSITEYHGFNECLFGDHLFNDFLLKLLFGWATNVLAISPGHDANADWYSAPFSRTIFPFIHIEFEKNHRNHWKIIQKLFFGHSFSSPHKHYPLGISSLHCYLTQKRHELSVYFPGKR